MLEVAILEMVCDDTGEIVDMLHRQANAAFERQGGNCDVVGRTIRALFPGAKDYRLNRSKQVARTGEPLRAEGYQQDLDRWFDISFSRFGAKAATQSPSSSTTSPCSSAPKRNVAMLDEVVRDLSALSSPDEIIERVGDTIAWLGTSIHVDDLRQLQERQGLLVAEPQHRTRNLITVVNAISNQTVREVASLSEFGSHFGDRLSALSQVQGLLSHLSAGQLVTFDELLGSELTALGAPAVKMTLDEPIDVALRSSTVQTFALAPHKLATHALKYGALASTDGHLTIWWHLATAGKILDCISTGEEGVDMTRIGDRYPRAGYERELIEHALPYQLDAETTYELKPEGVHCTTEVPTSTSTQEGTRTPCLVRQS